LRRSVTLVLWARAERRADRAVRDDSQMSRSEFPQSSRRKPGSICPMHEQLKGGSRLSPFAQAWLALTASGEAPLRREPGRRIGCVVLGLSFPLLLMGCAANDSASDDNRRGGKLDRKSTRLNSSHLGISYAVFCLKKKNKKQEIKQTHIIE